ncbi:phospholipase A [Psychrobium sp. 1_MG-2023]|uniref:phospholipase A n=1 Tax=Psychrobium sp. 1_MG-2023 TaxID=3062624 RepID=UPI000C32A81D|nr:phospholipase A [Psychrobium sp. 1_MG-2023]MDP2559801.1 phospholipase A [Psychrobium sp. 1_MG-2023]PKF59092.1 phospholipase [Alteromonadales bacterium alter-6D02]
MRKYCSILLATVLSCISVGVAAEDDCEKIIKDSKRLACFDKQGQQGATLFAGGLKTYKPNYFMLFSYNKNRADQLVTGIDTGLDADKTEAKFQFSFKHPIRLDVFSSDVDVWFAYTQKSFWQLYNTENSSPFRESNYEPEVWFEKSFVSAGHDGWHISKVSAGFNHQSNGRGELLSRSWNRIIGSAQLKKVLSDDQKLAVDFRLWRRLSEDADEDDNPDLIDYMGHGDVTAIYQSGPHQVSLQLRNILSGNSRHGISLDYSFPLRWSDNVRGYVQYFDGYGESLIDYNQKNKTISLGVAVAHWL